MWLKSSLDFASQSICFLSNFFIYLVGCFIVFGGSYGLVDVFYLRNQKEFKRIFGRYPKNISWFEVDRKIFAEYNTFQILKNKLCLNPQEEEILEQQIGEVCEKIMAMERVATINQFFITDYTKNIFAMVRKEVVDNMVPMA